MIEFRVDGAPVPQGSMVGLLSKTTGRVFIKPGNEKKLKAWRKQVAKDAAVVRPKTLYDGPVRVHTQFFRTRPASQRGQHYDSTGPDGDKLTRAIWDAITGVIVTNDARVAEWSGGKYFTDGEGYVLIQCELIDEQLQLV